MALESDMVLKFYQVKIYLQSCNQEFTFIEEDHNKLGQGMASRNTELAPSAIDLPFVIYSPTITEGNLLRQLKNLFPPLHSPPQED